MRKSIIVTSIVLLLLVGIVSAANPVYQAAPPTGNYLASGISDLAGPAGKAYVEYWVWDGAEGWYYYTYRIHNTDAAQPFVPYIKHLTIANPTGEPYVVTGLSGGYLWDYSTNQPTNNPGAAWLAGSHVSLPTLVDWVAPSISFVFPGQSSWQAQKFQFASQLPPSMAGLTLRQGDLTVYASGLTAVPGISGFAPRSTGYWKHQFGTKGNRKEAASLPDYISVITGNSQVYTLASGLNVTTGLAILEVPDNSVMLQKAKKELLGLWLNVVSGKLNYSANIAIKDPLGQNITISIQQAVTDVENTILNSGATQDQLEYAKDLAEILNNL